jgi:aspartyl-tRNA(Asn)/glutamyl-tRNA(Gln) amidotransferase subunit A
LHYLSRIEACQEYNCYIEVFDKEVLASAKKLDDKLHHNSEEMGQLFGAVFSIKDNICFNGHIASAGSKMLKDFVAPYSATVVERILEEDGLIIGRTNCDEFSMGSSNETSYYGPALNAVDKERVAGGSSGGAAVSVRLDTCLVALGSDTGGSIRQPAAFNGVIGYKPSYGMVSRWGLIAYASSFDQIGFIGHDIPTIEQVSNVVAGPDAFDSNLYSGIIADDLLDPGKAKELRIITFSDWIENDALHENVRQSTGDFLSKLKIKGFKIESTRFPFTDYLVPCYYILSLAEASSNLSRFDGIRYGHRTEKNIEDYKELMATNRSEGFGESVKRRIITGSFVLSEGYSEDYFVKAAKLRRKIKEYIEELFQEYDIIICPITTSEAFKLGSRSQKPVENYLSDVFSVLSNLCGIPSISVPISNNGGNLPLGIQLLSRQFHDKTALYLGNEINNLA